jgi:NAD(P)-dependent dehydrogenase (short-subunit alcohol dehydrogenase family)/acyl dehydratase
VTRTLLVSQEDVNRFAEASADRNPLHVDQSFARETPHGRCIAHGALVTLAALGIADPDRLGHVEVIDVQFRQPVFPGDEHVLSVPDSSREKMRIDIKRGGKVAATITVASRDDNVLLPTASQQESWTSSESPRRWTLEDFTQQPGLSLEERYTCRLDLLSALAKDLGAGHVPQAILAWLAAASYSVGMLIPGRDSIFVGARIARCSAPSSGSLRLSVTSVDDRTGMIDIDAALDEEEASARMALQAFLRQRVPTPDRSSIARYLPPSKDLSARTVLIVGASRGLGAALCGACVSQGATVWAGFSRSAKHLERLRRNFEPERIRPLQFDAEDPQQTKSAFEVLRREGDTLDGFILCAAPPPYEAALHPETSEGALRFLTSSLATMLNPLAEGLPLLSPDGWLVVMSSSAVDDPPQAWPHYVIAKAAWEGAAAYCARHTTARVLVVRAPKMWTDSTNTPMSKISAAPSEQIAAAITRWAIGNEASAYPSVLTADELTREVPTLSAGKSSRPSERRVG